MWLRIGFHPNVDWKICSTIHIVGDKPDFCSQPKWYVQFTAAGVTLTRRECGRLRAERAMIDGD